MTQSPARKGWFRRNWKWVVPLGCLTPILLCTGILTLVFALIFSAIKSSDPYKQGMQAVQNSPSLVSKLGNPIHPGFFATGTINVSGPSGNVDLAIPISGPKGSGTLYIVGTKSAGTWNFSKIRVKLDGSSEQIDLMGTEIE